MFPWSKHKLAAISLTADLEEAQAELQTERARRISAETLVTELREQLRSMTERCDRAEAARDESIKAQIAFLDQKAAPVVAEQSAPRKIEQADLQKLQMRRVSPMRRLDVDDMRKLMARNPKQKQEAKAS